MNMNQISAKSLAVGQDFIYNRTGGNTTVYRATRVRSGAGRTVIGYVIPESMGGVWEFSTASLSTLTLV